MLFVYIFTALLVGTGLYITSHEMHTRERHSARKLVSLILNRCLWAFMIIGTAYHVTAVMADGVIILETLILLAIAYAAVYAGFLMSKKNLFWLY